MKKTSPPKQIGEKISSWKRWWFTSSPHPISGTLSMWCVATTSKELPTGGRYSCRQNRQSGTRSTMGGHDNRRTSSSFPSLGCSCSSNPRSNKGTVCRKGNTLHFPLRTNQVRIAVGILHGDRHRRRQSRLSRIP